MRFVGEKMKQERVPIGDYITEYSVRNKTNEDIPVYSVTNSQGFCTEYFDKEVASKNKTTYKIVPRGYFAYNPSRINVGSVDWQKVEDRVIVSPLYNVFSVSEELEQQYLFYFLKSNIGKQMIQAKASGSVRDNLKLDMLKEITIPKRTVQEQKECVAVLDELMKIISLHTEKIEKYDNLVKARFVEMFGDPATPEEKYKTCKLGEVTDVKSSHRVFTTEFVDEGVPFYRGTEIGVLASGQQPKDPYKISMEHYLRIADDDSKPMRGDLLLPSICNKGQVWMVDTEEPFYYKDGRVLCISPDRSVFDSKYLQFYMKMRTEAEYPKLGSGSTFAEFKIFQLKELEVDIPPIETQQAFVLFVNQVDKSKLMTRFRCRKNATTFYFDRNKKQM